MKSNNKKSYQQLYFVIFLIIVLVLFFKTSLGSNLFNQLLIWKGNLQTRPLGEALPVNLDNFYYFENRALKERLSYQQETGQERKLFLVVSRGESNIYDTFLVSDPQQILEKGDLILGAFNLVLGKVEQPGKISKMKLFSANGEKNIFFLIDPENSIAFDVEVIGVGGGLLKVIINREIELSSNTVLKITEDNEYLVAKFVKEEFKTQDPNRVLFFQLLVNPYTLDKVEVEK